VRVVVENVIQDPTVAYSVSGTTLTFTSAPPSGTNNIYVVHLGPAVQTVQPPTDLSGNFTLSGDLTQTGDYTLTGAASVSGNLTVDTNTLFVDAANNRVGVGTSSPNAPAAIVANTTTYEGLELVTPTGDGSGEFHIGVHQNGSTSGRSIVFKRGGTDGMDTESLRIDASGNLLLGTTDTDPADNNVQGTAVAPGRISTNSTGSCLLVGRNGDGTIVTIFESGVVEGSISVSGTAVSYNGGHLSRWSQMADGSRPDLLRGTVMSNLDQMANWDGEDNEQLNCTAVSSVEGDPNVAGVFVAWDSEDDGYNDILLAMTGDFIIRIAQGTTVQRGDLLMSAGDGTAKPQGDDIIRSKTIAKVTSTHVTCTYEDGSYCVPCVLMAC